MLLDSERPAWPAGPELLATVSAWSALGAQALAPLLDALAPSLGSREEKLVLLVQLRLGGLIAASSQHGLADAELELARFIKLSQELRHRVAREKLQALARRVVQPFRPIKYALRLLNNEPTGPRRYFRDLDIEVPRARFHDIYAHATQLGFIAGDIDPDNWAHYLVTQDAALQAGIADAAEVHLFCLDNIDQEEAALQWAKIGARYPRLVEGQFYTTYRGTFLLRTFLDLELSEDGHERNADWQLDYLRSMLSSAIADVKRKRLGLNQFLELLSTAAAPPSPPILRVGDGRDTACDDAVLGAEFIAQARLSTINFIDEKIARR